MQGMRFTFDWNRIGSIEVAVAAGFSHHSLVATGTQRSDLAATSAVTSRAVFSGYLLSCLTFHGKALHISRAGSRCLDDHI